METNVRRIGRRLKREGWYLVRQRGGHDIYRQPGHFGHNNSAASSGRQTWRGALHSQESGLGGLNEVSSNC